METKSNNSNKTKAMKHEPLLPAVFSSDEMIAFGDFMRDNYYAVGSPCLLSYKPEKYPHGTVEEIFVIWCCENGR